MDLKCVFAEGEYKIWNHILKIPCRRIQEDGTTSVHFLEKDVEWDNEEVKSYWAYANEFGIWNLYRVYKDPGNRRLAWSSPTMCDLHMLMQRIQDKDITIHDCDSVDRADHYIHGPKKTITSNWSVKFEGQSIVVLLALHPKMSFKEVMDVIHNEGGFIDEKGIICRGTAEDKIVIY